jgi:hypothetical protein
MANFIKEHGTHKVDAYVPPAPEPEEELEDTLGEAAAAASKVAEEKAESATEKVKEATETVKEAASSAAAGEVCRALFLPFKRSHRY